VISYQINARLVEDNSTYVRKLAEPLRNQCNARTMIALLRSH
jgi:hypothetical protein